ncbi:hypothetical protein TPR58_00120 [Sphingomonas sp. HF-S3]|uniref:Uncharacterized protein n=1 Tax=Sphingomonas rustica TaxID=3103142 RepID=A0ABV0B4F6_9SPHN
MIRRVGPAMLAAAAALMLPPVAHASGPYAVDDAGITPAGHAQVEAWTTRSRGATLATVIPAVTLPGLPDVEWSLGWAGVRGRGVGDDRLSAQAKLALRHGDAGRPSFALAAGLSLDARSGRPAGGTVYGALTLPIGDRILVHCNAGVGHERGAAAPAAALWGVRAEAAILPERLSAHAELFDTGTSGPAAQFGIRPMVLHGHVDLELVYGHGLAGKGADSLTLGLAARF